MSEIVAKRHGEARQRERDVTLPDGQLMPAGRPHTGDASRSLWRVTGKRIGLDTSTSIAADANLSGERQTGDGQEIPPQES
jgi:hypothetical protein